LFFPKLLSIFATWEIAPVSKTTKSGLAWGIQTETGGTIMKNGRRKEDEYFFEYDNVYNLEHDELRAESASDTSVWYS
jgi:hypothetical protein